MKTIYDMNAQELLLELGRVNNTAKEIRRLLRRMSKRGHKDDRKET